MTFSSSTLPLDEVYVSLTAGREIPTAPERPDLDCGHPTGAPSPAERIQYRAKASLFDQVDIARSVRDSRRMVLLGAPGSGKTTVARFLAGRFAAAQLASDAVVTDRQGNSYGPPQLPIFARAEDYAGALKSDQSLSLLDFLPRTLARFAGDEKSLRALFEREINGGRALILLDGLDEVEDGQARSLAARMIDAFVTAIPPGNRLVVTSRLASYQGAPLGSAFEQFVLRDMDEAQIERFVEAWCLATERFQAPGASEESILRRAQAERDSLLHALAASEGIRRLAGNPLLLTILALIHRNGGRLPERRIELYDLAARTLLRDWRLAQAGPGAAVVEEGEALEMLGPLAYWMHDNAPSGLIGEAEALAQLCGYLAEARRLNSGDPEARAAAEDFLRRVREHTGLFVEREPGQYGFMHLTFEEYFAAREIVSDYATAPDRVRAHRHQSRWEEALRLAIAHERPKNAAHLVRAAIWDRSGGGGSYVPSEYEEILHRDLLLAAHCLADCASTEASLARDMAEDLVNLLLCRSESLDCAPLHEKLLDALTSLRGTTVAAEARSLLLAATQADEGQSRALAIGGLAALVGPDLTLAPVLLRALADECASVRAAATTALGNRSWASQEIERALVRALQDADASVRAAAAKALTGLDVGSPAAVKALGEAASDSDVDVVWEVIGALGWFALPSPDPITQFLATTKEAPMRARWAAALTIGSISRSVSSAIPQAEDALLGYLNDSASSVRWAAAYALGKLGPGVPQVVSALLLALREDDVAARWAYARALAETTPPSHWLVAALLQGLSDEDPMCRFAAAQALGVLGEIEPLLYALSTSSPVLTFNIVQALGDSGQGSPAVVAALLNALSHSEPVVRASAAKALAKLAAAAPGIVPALLHAIDDEEASVRASAAEGLGASGEASRDVIHALVRCARDADRSVRSAAWTALWGAVQN